MDSFNTLTLWCAVAEYSVYCRGAQRDAMELESFYEGAAISTVCIIGTGHKLNKTNVA